MKKILTICLFLFSTMLQALVCEDNSRFVVEGQEIYDTETGLIWQRCAIGLSGKECKQGTAKKYDWKEALDVIKKQNQKTGKHWRFPDFQELNTIVKKYCKVQVLFLKYKAFKYWTALQKNDGSYNESNLYFNFGTDPLIVTHRFVQLVRTQ